VEHPVIRRCKKDGTAFVTELGYFCNSWHVFLYRAFRMYQLYLNHGGRAAGDLDYHLYLGQGCTNAQPFRMQLKG